MTGDHIVCQRIRVVTMIVVTINVFEETANMLAQGVVQDQRRFSRRAAPRRRLREHVTQPSIVDLILKPLRLREKARQVGLIGAIQDASRNVRQTLVR